ncbi:hypothetical protein Tco_1251525 [Tanacetum coccineum]
MLLDYDYMLVDLGDMETQGETSNANTHVESNEVLPPPMTPTATQDQTEADDGSNEVLQLSVSSSGGAKHLNDHYKRCLYRPISDIRQHILVEDKNKADGTPSSFLSNYTFNEDTSRQNLDETIIVHEHPLSMVGHYGF